MKQSDEIERRLREIWHVNSFPENVARILSQIDQPGIGISRISSIISADQVLASRALKLANSGIYSHGNRIATLDEAAVRIGATGLRNLCLSVGAFGALDIRESGSFNRASFFQHSYGTGLCAALLSDEQSRGDVQSAFVAGLLHDFGKLILVHLFPKDVSKLIDAATAQNVLFSSLERDFFAIGHAEVGARVFEAWKFPQELIQVLREHHDSAASNSLIRAVHHADELANCYLGPSPGPRTELDDVWFKEVGMCRERFEEDHLETLQEELNRGAALLGIRT